MPNKWMPQKNNLCQEDIQVKKLYKKEIKKRKRKKGKYIREKKEQVNKKDMVKEI